MKRALLSALTCATFLSTSFHAHDPGSRVDVSTVLATADQIRSATSHPTAPLHIESVQLEHAPRCPECLLRQNTPALGASEPTHDSSLAPSRNWFVSEPALAVLRRASEPGQPRAPPRV